jgi:hypothetical protein
VWGYVGADLSGLFQAYFSGGISDKNFDWQQNANVCAAFYEQGLLWIRTAPVRVDWTEALYFAVKNGNYSTAKQYQKWADDRGGVVHTDGPMFTHPSTEILVETGRAKDPDGDETIQVHALFAIATIDSGRMDLYEQIKSDYGKNWLYCRAEEQYIDMHLAAHGIVEDDRQWADVLELAVLWGSAEAVHNIIKRAGEWLDDENPALYYLAWFQSRWEVDHTRSMQILNMLHELFAGTFELHWFLFEGTHHGEYTVPRISAELAADVIISSVRKRVLKIIQVDTVFHKMTVSDTTPLRLFFWHNDMISNDDPFWALIGLETPPQN